MRVLTLFVLLCLVAFAGATDYGGEFVRNPGGNLALKGLPGYASTPARLAQPGLGISYVRLSEIDMQVAGAAGEFSLDALTGAKGDSASLSSRVAFGASYLALDSLYRQVYTELSFSVSYRPLVLGVAYGFSAEWVPAPSADPDALHWDRHRYKSGAAFVLGGLSLSAMLSGWTSAPLAETDYAFGARLEVGRFAGFVEWDGLSFDVGSAVRFRFLEIRSSYRFPDFGVAVSLSFWLENWSLEGVFGTGTPIRDWFGVSLSKQIRKKTIL